jgi:hypothetical protein
MYRRFLVFVIVLGLAGHASAGLVGYWPLNGDGTDLSDYGNDGTINGNVVPGTGSIGDPNGAMVFAGGGGDAINVGNPSQLQMTGAMTITAWVYLDSTSPVHGSRNGRIVGKMGGGGQRSWSTGIEANVSGVDVPATVQVASNGNTVVSLSDDSPLPMDQWVHYAGVFTPGISMQVYLNGQLAATRTDSIPASQHANDQPALIGHRPACSNCGWYGSLDEVRIYNEALGQTQIASIMAINGIPAQMESNNPEPGIGATGFEVVGTAMTWKPGVDLANPTVPNPAITGYYLWISPAYDPLNPPSADGWWTDPGVQTIFVNADTNNDQQVDETASYTPADLQRDSFYYWAVDESLGAASESDLDNLILGNTWSFETITSAPVVDAGDSIVTWLKDGATTVDLNGVVTDDTGDVTATTWSVVASPDDTTVDIADISAAITTATFTATGQYTLELHAIDARANEDANEVQIDVYNDSCEAAQNNPNGYTSPAYDFNADCRVDFADFALFAIGWLQDESLTEDALYRP